MPLFGSHQAPSPPPPPEPSPSRSRSLFSRRNNSLDHEPAYDSNHSTNSNGPGSHSGGGFFSRRRSSDASSDDGYVANGGNLKNDPSIRGARQKVADAEAYEREADRALGQARASVREAREHVRLLEREVLEE
ncbi:hypothetical protein PHLCEN_2v611 [Hermanssonia centrifuga]|uniref:Uncharacterized protein n=1 Tax=Hermanssonia centrifuga TaxID=98765 RepID=A0A2R6S5K1_9APHY|nr:hypothetical protein PHLCEN_2v611 [Hermanssonia centrifuga]